MGGFQKRYGVFEEETNILLMPGIEADTTVTELSRSAWFR